MKTANLIKIGFFVLVALNAVLIFLLVSGPPHPKGPPKTHGNGASQIQVIGDKLSLTADQMDQYTEMAKEHRETIKRLQEQQKPLVQSYFELLKVPIDSQAYEQLISKILALERNKITYTYSHFEGLKAILTKNQTAQFDKIVDDIVHVLLGEEKNMPPRPRDF